MNTPAWMSLPPIERYLAGTRKARQVRDERARAAGRAAIALAREIAAARCRGSSQPPSSA